MVLAVELDNTKISFGVFNGDKLICDFNISTNVERTSDEYLIISQGLFKHFGVMSKDIDGAIVSSVVPQLTDVMLDVIKKFAGDVKTIILGMGCKTGFPIKVDNPSELGGDIVANAAAVIAMMGVDKKPCIIVDMGTASTIFAINGKGEFIGGTIIPGMGISADVLHDATAQIPAIGLSSPTKVIGKNTKDSVRSGIVFGNAFMVDSFIDKFCDEMNVKDIEIFITGDYANVVIPMCRHKMIHIPSLTLKGLHCIYKNNIR